MLSVSDAHSGIKVGVLVDFVYPAPGVWDVKADFIDGLELTFEEAFASGLIDRPIELVERWVEGLPRGAVKPVLDAYDELVDEGCVVIIGPLISENAIPLREHIERGGFVPSISWCGTEAWLGEWTFALSDGSLTEEPYVIASLLAEAGHRRIGVSYERSAIGTEYLHYLRQACDLEGLEIVATATIAQTVSDATDLVDALHLPNVDAIVHVGFGLGLVRINEALAAAGWDPPRYTTTAWETCYVSDELFEAFQGWIGIAHYDETNTVGQTWLDRFEAKYGRRPEYEYSLYPHDVGRVIATALARAEPISPTGVKLGLEQVKMLHAACGSPGTRISFGNQRRNGWHGVGYLTARSINDDLKSTRLRGRAIGNGPT
jgi:branched-chain amino acid transport system substrate-binding protein